MWMKVFAVYDSKAAAYQQPFFAPNPAVACRMVERAVNDANTDFHRYAADYTLFEIGAYDDASGSLVAAEKQVNLGVLITFLKEGS